MDADRFDALLGRIDADLALPRLRPLRVADVRIPSTLDDQDYSVLRRLGVTFAEATAGVPALKAALVRDRETAEQQQQLGNPSPLFVVETGEVCPPRPLEPPLAQQSHRPWWRRWLPW